MAIDRREFLRLGLGLAALPLAGRIHALEADNAGLRFYSCRADAEGRYLFSALDAQGHIRFDVPLPARGHGMALHPNHREVAVFARRPGSFLLVVDSESGQLRHQITSPEGRHFYGHGVFDPAGRMLYVTENDFDAERGVIAVYDAADGYRRVGEFDSHGIGPHELCLLSDGNTLVIANGGILTHPDTGRHKLNIPEMDPSLAYVEAASGRLLSAYRPPAEWHQLSIRHLDVGRDDRVCVAMQYQGALTEQPPLIAFHAGEDQLQFRDAPMNTQNRMRNYCGSVRADHSGRVFAVSAPRGGLSTLWDAQGRYLATVQVADGCGIASTPDSGGFLISSGHGGLFEVHGANAERSLLHDHGDPARWDNHMIGEDIGVRL